MYSFKPPTAEQQAFWEMRVESFDAVVQAMKAGESSNTVLDARDRVYEAWGYPSAKGINSYTAHGIGVDSLEPPWIPGKERIMQENMIINTHPAVRIDDPVKGSMLGGISIADNVLVTADGPVRMVDQVDEWIVLDC